MISDDKKQHYLVVKKLSALFLRNNMKNNGDVYCLNCLHSYQTKTKLESYEKGYKYQDQNDKEIPSKNDQIKYTQGQKSIKLSCFFYADTVYLYENITHMPGHLYIAKVKILHAVTQYLQSVHLTTEKINMITTKLNIA